MLRVRLIVFSLAMGLDGVWLAFPFVVLAGVLFALVVGAAGLWKDLKRPRKALSSVIGRGDRIKGEKIER